MSLSVGLSPQPTSLEQKSVSNITTDTGELSNKRSPPKEQGATEDCAPAWGNISWRNTGDRSVSSLPLNKLLTDQELCWEGRRPQNWTAGGFEKHRAPLLPHGAGCRLWEHLIPGVVPGRAGLGLRSTGRLGSLWFSPGAWSKHRGPTRKKVKAVHYLFNFTPFPQNCSPTMDKGESDLASTDHTAWVVTEGVSPSHSLAPLPFFPSISFHGRTLLSECLPVARAPDRNW